MGRKKKSAGKTGNFTVGVITDWFANSYHVTLLNSIVERAKDHGLNIITFIGGSVNSPLPGEKSRNIIYNFFQTNLIDGIIVFAATITRYCDRNGIKKFYDRFLKVPVIAISEHIPGIPSVLIDNKKGMKDLILHLIHEHEYRRIAFIKGPVHNYDAVMRFEGYREALEEAGISYNGELVVQGDFNLPSGVDAVKELLANSGNSFDAIIAPNDRTAKSIIGFLQSSGIKVPGEKAVTGFDDESGSGFFVPALSTVRQPYKEMGTKAVEMMAALLHGEKIGEKNLLPTECVIRESCGCKPRQILHSFHMKLSRRIGDYRKELKPGMDTAREKAAWIQKEMTALLARYYPGNGATFDFAVIDQITGCFTDALYKDDFDDFYISIMKLLAGFEKAVYGQDLLQQIISIICSILVCDISGSEYRGKADNLFRTIRLLAAAKSQELYGISEYTREIEIRLVRDINEDIIADTSLESIIELLGRHLPDMGIGFFSFSLYEGEMQYGILPEMSRLMFLYRNNAVIPVGREGILYPTLSVLPGEFHPSGENHSFLFEALTIETYQMGFALLEYKAENNILTAIARRTLINSALKSALFIRRVHDQTMKLDLRTKELSETNLLLTKTNRERELALAEVQKLNEDLEKHIAERTEALNKANIEIRNTLRRLQTTQKELVESEKMAALGGLVAGIAHEINTPIGIGVTASSHLDIMTDKIISCFEDNSLKKSELLNYFRTTKQAASMIRVNLQRAYELIGSFKQIAVDQSVEEKRKFNLASYIEEILLSLQHRLKQTNLTVTVQCTPNMEIKSFPGAFSQVITNFVINSIIHGYNKKDTGQILIDVKKQDNTLILCYSDDGKGISPKNMEKIFHPFFTTNRANGGTGLGLHIVYNIVTQKLKGRIECSSHLGKGTKFTITIPLSS